MFMTSVAIILSHGVLLTHCTAECLIFLFFALLVTTVYENLAACGGGPKNPPACLVAAREGARPNIFWMF